MKEKGELGFGNNMGISVEDFLELIYLYVESTLVAFLGNIVLQKDGIPMGSRVGPVLNDPYLARCATY